MPKINSNRFKNQMGISLLESLVTVALLGLIGLAIVNGFTTSAKITGLSNDQTVARTLITEYIESMRSLPYSADYTSAGDNVNVPPGYSVVIVTEGTYDDVIWQASTGNETLQRISVSVLAGGRHVLTICTFRTRRN